MQLLHEKDMPMHAEPSQALNRRQSASLCCQDHHQIMHEANANSDWDVQLAAT